MKAMNESKSHEFHLTLPVVKMPHATSHQTCTESMVFPLPSEIYMLPKSAQTKREPFDSRYNLHECSDKIVIPSSSHAFDLEAVVVEEVKNTSNLETIEYIDSEKRSMEVGEVSESTVVTVGDDSESTAVVLAEVKERLSPCEDFSLQDLLSIPTQNRSIPTMAFSTPHNEKLKMKSIILEGRR